MIDGGNATPSIFLPKLLEEIGCETVPIYCEIGPKSSRGFLDPIKLDHYKDLIQKVLDSKADLGIMLDGDGDRVGFVDEKGQIWLGDILLILLIREIIPN